MTIRTKIIITLAVLFVLFVVGSIGMVKFTERPEFCITCHNMDPYYDAWKSSTHSEVNCLECHYEPGLKAHVIGKIHGLVQVVQYVTGRYSNKPAAEVSDLSCLREGCHEKVKLESKKVLYRGRVEFQHKAHFGEIKAGITPRCTSCHMQLTSADHIKVDGSPCFICHFKNVPSDKIAEQCSTCHKKSELTDEHIGYVDSGMTCTDCHSAVKSSNGDVRENMCYVCHADAEKIKEIKNKELIHKAHINAERKVDCISCHDFIKHN